MAIGICRLCQHQGDLRHSHVLPEFFYLEIYESRESHKALAITENGERTIQKGLREYLFCQQCETKLSRYETYTAKLIRDIANFHHDASGRFIFSEDVDYLKFKLFQLSILWRAGISSLDGFSQVSLGPHEEILRCMLVDENPGKACDYGCVMMTMLNTEILHKVISSPIRIRPRPFGHTAYKFATGNLTWIFFVTSQPLVKQIQEFFVQENGLLRIWLSSDETTPIINIAKNLQRLERERKSG